MYFGFEDITIAFRTKTVLQHVTLDIPREKTVAITVSYTHLTLPTKA